MAVVSNSKLLHNTEGIRRMKDALVVLVKTEWNHAIVDKLEEGCAKLLKENGVKTETITVPGAVEIPFAVAHTWRTAAGKKNQPDAFITLGCVIRGDPPHFDYVCQSVTSGVTQLNISIPVPVIFGVLTVENEKQALERCGGVHGHKGEEAAVTALKMIALARRLKKSK